MQAYVLASGARECLPARPKAMKFTTLIPTTRNDGTEVGPAVLSRLIDRLWRPFRGMAEEGWVT